MYYYLVTFFFLGKAVLKLNLIEPTVRFFRVSFPVYLLLRKQFQSFLRQSWRTVVRTNNTKQ